MATNPNGLVLAADGGVPRSFTATAREVVSGGEFVFCSGANAVIGSSMSSYVYGDILVATNASGGRVNGVAEFNAGSNSAVTIISRGKVIVSAGGTIVAGDKVDVDGSNAVIATVNYAGAIGRALASAASGGFTLIDLYC